MRTASLNIQKYLPESSELSSGELGADERIYVIVLNYKRWAVTIECVESVLRSTGVNVTIVICDNNSPDGSMDQLRAWARGEQKPLDPANPSLASLSRPHAPKPINFIELNRQQAEAGEGHRARVVLIRTGDNLGYAGGIRGVAVCAFPE